MLPKSPHIVQAGQEHLGVATYARCEHSQWSRHGFSARHQENPGLSDTWDLSLAYEWPRKSYESRPGQPHWPRISATFLRYPCKRCRWRECVLATPAPAASSLHIL